MKQLDEMRPNPYKIERDNCGCIPASRSRRNVGATDTSDSSIENGEGNEYQPRHDKPAPRGDEAFGHFKLQFRKSSDSPVEEKGHYSNRKSHEKAHGP